MSDKIESIGVAFKRPAEEDRMLKVVDGVATKELRSSKGLKVGEFTNYLQELEELALEYGVR